MNSLIDLLHQLDQRLNVAMMAAEALFQADSRGDPYRGIQIGELEVKQLLTQVPSEPRFPSPDAEDARFVVSGTPDTSALAWLQEEFGLDEFDVGVLAIAIAPELDRRYERLYVYLQDDVRAKRPTVDLCLNLLCTSALEKMSQRVHFAPEAPLIHSGLLHLIPDPHQSFPSLLAHIIKLDPLVVRLLLGQEGLDERLSAFCQIITPKVCDEDLPLSPRIKKALPEFVKQSRLNKEPLMLYFSGGEEWLKDCMVQNIAQTLTISLWRANINKIPRSNIQEFSTVLRVLLQASQLQNTLLFLMNLDSIKNSDCQVFYQELLTQLSHYSSVVILSGVSAWDNAGIKIKGILTVDFPDLDFKQRHYFWQKNLQALKINLSPEDIISLSGRFQLNSQQIANAVTMADHYKKWQNLDDSEVLDTIQAHDLFRAARRISDHSLDELAKKVNPKYVWDDIILSTYQKGQLQEICNQIKFKNLVWETWGFKEKQSLGRGLNVMFSGPSGTGKTMAAEVIAQELQFDLYKIDLSQVVNKYIGETEKNLNKIFEAATHANVILLFDEADALFGKRSNVKDAHDRYANLEVSYLLQKMEEYEGLAILTTNLCNNMDEAFTRRLQFIIDFSLPNEKQRYEIWQKAFPAKTPCHGDLGFSFLAHNFELTGGNIRNIALKSAFLAASEGRQVERVHIIQGVRREYQKIGKILKKDIEDGYL
ncbi:ATP-binding protein [Spirulina subsalsa]|uniref:ATP-binding protein n=1 Tax=Spirulina subsalsa TaxID=54311 RepID=UPI00031D3DC5|nr:ATP-binding protein [Spirulina subsalsa]